MNTRKYTCPMHPEVILNEPRNCPKCGMTLEPIMPRAAETKTIYTCPMHPEIEQDHPGQCPKCGMTLEPKTVGGVHEQELHEIRSLFV
jgi:P-type Cu+ transporter